MMLNIFLATLGVAFATCNIMVLAFLAAHVYAMFTKPQSAQDSPYPEREPVFSSFHSLRKK